MTVVLIERNCDVMSLWATEIVRARRLALLTARREYRLLARVSAARAPPRYRPLGVVAKGEIDSILIPQNQGGLPLGPPVGGPLGLPLRQRAEVGRQRSVEPGGGLTGGGRVGSSRRGT